MLIVLYVAAIAATNLAFAHLGIVNLGGGIMAPAAAFLAAVPLTLRDFLHERYGKRVTVAAMVVAAALTALFSPALALASATAFLLGEALDLTAFSVARKRAGFLPAMIGSNVVGALVDSVVFLSIAFGSLSFLPGQMIAKLATTVVAAVLVAVARR